MAKEAVIAATHQKGEATVKKSNHSKFILMCLFLIIDIALNSTLDYDNYDFSDRNLISGLFGVQVIVQITVFLILFLAAADTFLFQVGLLGILLREVFLAFLFQAGYFLISIVVGSLRSKQYRNSHTLVDNMNNDTFFYVSLIQKLGRYPFMGIHFSLPHGVKSSFAGVVSEYSLLCHQYSNHGEAGRSCLLQSRCLDLSHQRGDICLLFLSYCQIHVVSYEVAVWF